MTESWLRYMFRKPEAILKTTFPRLTTMNQPLLRNAFTRYACFRACGWCREISLHYWDPRDFCYNFWLHFFENFVIIEMIKNFIFLWFIDLFSLLPSVRFQIIILLNDYLYFPYSSSSSPYIEGDLLQMLFCYFDAYVRSGCVCLHLRYLLSPICFL